MKLNNKRIHPVRYLMTGFIIVIGLVTIIGSGGGGGDGTPPDIIAPSVINTSPVDGAINVPVNSAVSVSFSEAMNSATISTSTIRLMSVGGMSIPGSLKYNGQTAVFTPSSPLPYASTFTLIISADVTDLAGNSLAVEFTCKFTTGDAPDLTPPNIISTAPTTGATDITINSAISVNFSEVMDPSTINTSSLILKDSENNQISASLVDHTGAVATFTLASDLEYSTAYTATISAEVRDLAGNAMLNDYFWTFTTVAAPDTTPPTVHSTSPSIGAIDVSVNTAVSATFSEAMELTTINSATFTLKDGSNNSVAGTVNYTGTTATFTPANAISSSTVYTATITTGVEDLAGNAMSQDHVWSFTTGIAADTTPPTVFSTIPVDAETDILATSTVSATFSEAIDPATVDTNTFFVRYGALGAFFAGTVSYANATATFTPVGLPYDSLLTATITTGIKDLAGNAMVSDYTWSFTIADAPQAVLDTSFGTNGKVLTDVSGINDLSDHGDVVRDLIVQSDGKIVAAGYSYNGNVHSYDFALARYESNGVLDSNFGAGGMLMTDFGGSDYLYGAVIQSDGKIVVAGSSFSGGDGNIALARYNVDGTLDTSFGHNGNGKVITDFGGNDFIRDVALLSNGKILVVGLKLGTPSGTVLARYTSDGFLDATFGTGGIIIDSTIPQMEYIREFSIQSDDKIVVSGTASDDFMLVRYNANGTLDMTFDNDGKVLTDFGGNDFAEAITIAPDGKIILAGWSGSIIYNTFALARYNTDGSLDTTFDSDGKLTTYFGGLSSVSSQAVSVQADGKIVAAGSISYINNSDKPADFALARYNNNGTLDIAFGENGLATADFDSDSDVAYALSIQPDSKILAAGTSNTDFALLRLIAQ